jgi:hypothetical protein
MTASPERHEGSRDRREGWEREREREREGREREGRRQHSRERDHSDHYEESRRPPTSHKTDYDNKKFYKNVSQPSNIKITYLYKFHLLTFKLLFNKGCQTHKF